ncbi:MAG: hypothetical protein AB1896_19645 [Thermodesulfobacteriota bacterium]
MGELCPLKETTLDNLAEQILDEAIEDNELDEAVLIMAKDGRGASVRHYGEDTCRKLGLLLLALAGVLVDWLGRADEQPGDQT